MKSELDFLKEEADKLTAKPKPEWVLSVEDRKVLFTGKGRPFKLTVEQIDMIRTGMEKIDCFVEDHLEELK